MEHALTEWRDGTIRRADFKEDNSVRYFHHLAGVQHVEKKAPAFMTKLQTDLFKSMLYVCLVLLW